MTLLRGLLRFFLLISDSLTGNFIADALCGSRVFLKTMRTLHGTTTLLRAACSSQKKPEEFPYIVGVEMLGESSAVLCVREADSSAAASPAYRGIRQRIPSPFLQCTNR